MGFYLSSKCKHKTKSIANISGERMGRPIRPHSHGDLGIFVQISIWTPSPRKTTGWSGTVSRKNAWTERRPKAQLIVSLSRSSAGENGLLQGQEQFGLVSVKDTPRNFRSFAFRCCSAQRVRCGQQWYEWPTRAKVSSPFSLTRKYRRI